MVEANGINVLLYTLSEALWFVPCSSFLFSDILKLLSIYARTLSLFVVDLPRALLRVLSSIRDRVFCKINQSLSVGNHFPKKALSYIFDRILNTASLPIVKIWKKLHFSNIAKFFDRSLNLAVHTCSMHCRADYYNSLLFLRVSLPLQNMHIAKPISLSKNRSHRDNLVS